MKFQIANITVGLSSLNKLRQLTDMQLGELGRIVKCSYDLQLVGTIVMVVNFPGLDSNNERFIWKQGLQPLSTLPINYPKSPFLWGRESGIAKTAWMEPIADDTVITITPVTKES